MLSAARSMEARSHDKNVSTARCRAAVSAAPFRAGDMRRHGTRSRAPRRHHGRGGRGTPPSVGTRSEEDDSRPDIQLDLSEYSLLADVTVSHPCAFV